MKRRRLWTLALGAVGVLALSLGTGTAAQAATGPGGQVITCTVSLDDPHASGHVNGTISAQGRVTCGATVAEIYIKTTLTNVNTGTAASQTFDSFNVKAGSSVGAKSCAEGPATFRSNASVVVQFPAGFTPNRQILNRSSPNKSVACGVSRAVPGSDAANDGATEAFTVTLTARS